MRRAVNNFFSDNGEPCRVTVTDPDGVTRAFEHPPWDHRLGQCRRGRCFVGHPDVPDRLQRQDARVETENAGISQAFYEQAGAGTAGGWLGIRGISDHANVAKDDRYHEVASWHAAVIMERLAPYLAPVT